MTETVDELLIPAMSPQQVRAARKVLGRMWGLGRPATPLELAAELGLGGRDPGGTILKWERGAATPSGPVSRLLQALLAGFRPSALPNQPQGRGRLSGRS